MSDLQPRKRKDKRRKKGPFKEDSIAGEDVSSTAPTNGSGNTKEKSDDYNIHVHHDASTGGGWCAKIIFFILLTILGLLIGVILFEYRGSSDLDAPLQESKYAEIFHGWVDDTPQLHDDEEHGLDDDHDNAHSEEEDDAHDESGEVAESDLDEANSEEQTLSDDNDVDEQDEHDEQDEVSQEDEVEEQEDEVDEQEDEVDNQSEDVDDNQSEDVDDKDDNEETKENFSTESILNVLDSLADDEPLEEVENDDDNFDQSNEVVDNNPNEVKILEKVEEDAANGEEESTGVAVKFGVGVALVVVAHLVLVRKWNNAQNTSPELASSISKIGASAEPPTPESLSRRNTIVPTIKTVQCIQEAMEKNRQEIQVTLHDEDVEEELSEEEVSEDEDVHTEIENITAQSVLLVTKTPELGKFAPLPRTPSPLFADEDPEEEEEVEDEEVEEVEDEEVEEEEEEEEEVEAIKIVKKDDKEVSEDEEEEEEDDDEELLKKLEAKYGKLPDKDLTNEPEKDEEESEEEDDEAFPSWRRVKPIKQVETKLTGSDSEEERPSKSSTGAKTYQEEDDILDDMDYYRDHPSYNDKVEETIAKFQMELKRNSSSSKALYGLAMALDRLAEIKQSNIKLQESIEAYVQFLKNGGNVSDHIYQVAGERCINRMRFKGDYKAAVEVHKLLINKFPSQVEFHNQLAVTYLMNFRLAAAKTLLADILSKWPDNGYAKVHYGFVLKTYDNNIDLSIKYLKEGIESREAGVLDGRFYFHLGDALTRMGRHDEAMAVYADGVKNGLFLSKYQRSLYNVKRLKGQPWWTPEETGHSKQLNFIQQNWKKIRDEAMALLNSKGLFKDEAENLRDVGDWKQFEMYSRGRQMQKNCAKAPITCGLVDKFTAASKCRRGQVKFSVMEPSTHVWPHCGPTNCRLRAHLGLKVPKHTSIRVAEQVRGWTEGEFLIFDDSFEHEVWHNGTGTRLILIIDLWHPELTESEKKTLPAI